MCLGSGDISRPSFGTRVAPVTVRPRLDAGIQPVPLLNSIRSRLAYAATAYSAGKFEALPRSNTAQDEKGTLLRVAAS